MKVYQTSNIRNVCLIGHSSGGKTLFCEAALFNSGVTNRIGKIADGNTVCDYDAEEIRRKASIRTVVAPIEWHDHKINLIDTPGYFDFAGDMISGIKACDTAMIMVSGKSGMRVGGELAFRYATENNKAIAFFINKMDHENAKFDEVVAELQDKFGQGAAIIQMPIIEGGKFVGYIDVIEGTAFQFDGAKMNKCDVPEDMYADLQQHKGALFEVIAEADEDLMEKFFSDTPFTKDDLKKGIEKAMEQRILFPILCGSCEMNAGINTALDTIEAYFPSPATQQGTMATKNGEAVELKCEDGGPLAALVFKTIIDSFVGKVNMLKVCSGVLKANSTVYNTVTDTMEKIGQLIVMRGKEKLEVDQLHAGDIGAVTKLVGTHTGSTLCAQGDNIVIEPAKFPVAVYSMAITPKTRGDEEKISSGLQKIREEDPTIKYENNSEVRQMIVSGMGDQHLEIVLAKLKAMGTDAMLIAPKITYRETITKKISAEGKHKKQSGGHGQYGHVKIDFEPCEGDGLQFSERIFGGSVPKNYHPAVEKGLQEMMDAGIQAGYRVVGLKAELHDGSYHDVDSSEMAFKLAAHLAFKELVKAGPIILEPIGKLEVTIPDDYMGDVMGDVNKRRGRVLGMESGKIVAEIPVSEMTRYAIDLRSMTGGRGSFIFDFDRYEQTPPNIAQKIIEEHKNSKAEQ